MNKKILLLVAICVAIVILLYVCHMLAPLLDDVWKILLVGAIIGAIPGFYGGVKWKEIDLEIKAHEEKRRS